MVWVEADSGCDAHLRHWGMYSTDVWSCAAPSRETARFGGALAGGIHPRTRSRASQRGDVW